MQKTKVTLIVICFFVFVFLFFSIPTNIYATDLQEIKIADGIINPENFEPPGLTNKDTDIITNKASNITNIIGIIGVVVTVITLILIGIKYMTGSIEEKADYKKSMIPYLIGVFIFFSLTQLLEIIVKIIGSINIP